MDEIVEFFTLPDFLRIANKRCSKDELEGFDDTDESSTIAPQEARSASYYDAGGVDAALFTEKTQESIASETKTTCRSRCRTRVYSPCYAGFTASINILSLV